MITSYQALFFLEGMLFFLPRCSKYSECCWKGRQKLKAIHVNRKPCLLAGNQHQQSDGEITADWYSLAKGGSWSCQILLIRFLKARTCHARKIGWIQTSHRKYQKYTCEVFYKTTSQHSLSLMCDVLHLRTLNSMFSDLTPRNQVSHLRWWESLSLFCHVLSELPEI